MATLHDVKFRLSGYAANVTPAYSLGSTISTSTSAGAVVLSQTASALTTVTGVTINDAAGNAVGNGTLSFTNSSQTLRWTPPAGTTGTAVTVSSNGTYGIQGGSNGGYLLVTVVAASLPGSDVSNTVAIANQTNKIFDDVSKAESLAGDTEYRCLFIKNEHSTDSITGIKLWIGSNTPGQDTVALALDGTGKGTAALTSLEATKALTNSTWSGSVAEITSTAHGYAVNDLVEIAGVTPSGYNGTYVVTTVADANTFTYALTSDPGAGSAWGTAARYSESVAPTGPDFDAVNPISEATALTIGDLAAGESYPFWIRRTVPANTTEAKTSNPFKLSFLAYT